MGASVLAEMHLIPVVFLLLGATSLTESSGCPSSGGWIPLGDHCYLLSPTNMNWFQAQQFCEEKGGYLAEILSESEQTNLKALLNIRQDQNYWIGLSDVASEGNFVWQHSFTPLGEYTHWQAGQPDNWDGHEDCIIMMKGSEWGWNDEDCDNIMRKSYSGNHALCQY